MKNNHKLGASTHNIAPKFKLPLFMRISLVLLFSVVLQLSAVNVFGQKMRQSVVMRNVTLGQVLNKIEQVSDYVFLYNNKTINSNRIVSVESNSREIPTVLDQLFKDTNITYTVVNKQIILSIRNKERKESERQQQPKNVIKGTVVDAKGEPLIGVNVKVKGSAAGVITDVNGRFSLQTDNSEQLEFSYVGDTSKVVKASQGMKITLIEDNKMLNEVVVTALGIKKESKALSYNVQEVKGADLIGVKDANLMNSLSGKVAGVVINASSSGIGGGVKVVMRGAKSLSNNNNAFYVIDGIPMPSLQTKIGRAHV